MHRHFLVFAGSLLISWTLSPRQVEAQFRFPIPYGGYRYAPEADLRMEVTPKDAAVYVDGYFAGFVDEFDGTFQRLHVTPGEHEIVVYLQGYRSIRERLYLSPNRTRKIVRTMDRLAPGEPSEAAPQPTESPERAPAASAGRPAPRRGAPGPGPRPGSSARPRDVQGSTLVIRVQPSEADVLIDGELWRGPSGDERLVVQVTDGLHRVEVRKESYRTFVTEVEVRGGEAVPLNISLPRDR